MDGPLVSLSPGVGNIKGQLFYAKHKLNSPQGLIKRKLKC